MRFIIDILHPRHVHFFRHFIAEMEGRGHQFLITARDKDCTVELLQSFKLPHVVISKQRRGAGGLAVELAERLVRFVKVAKEFSPDSLLSYMGPTIAIAGKLLRVPSVVFYDNETAGILNRVVAAL